jgi:membrane protein DedA with SNARE-associated domain
VSFDWPGLLNEFGYAATFAGVMLEGESFLVLSGVAASRGILVLPWLIAIGAVGAFVTDNLFFVMGRRFGPGLQARFPWLAHSAGRAKSMVDRSPVMAVIGMRFFYGLRTVGPAIVGASGMKWGPYALLDGLAATVWSALWVSVGRVLGEAALRSLEVLGHAGAWLAVGATASVAIGCVVLRARRESRVRSRPSVRFPKPRVP